MALALAATDTLAAKQDAGGDVNYAVDGDELTGTTDAYRVLAAGQLSTTAATLYTPGATKSAIVGSITLTNTGASTRTVTLYRNGTAAANQWGPLIALAPSECAEWTVSGWRVLDSTGKQKVSILTPMTTKGDLLTFDTQNQRLAAGSDNSYLRPLASQATGLRYSGPSAASPASVTGSAGSAGTAANPPAADDHAHQHAAITTGDLHTEYTREAVLTAKGSLYAATAAGVPADLPVAANGALLAADSAAAPGVAWKTSQYRLTGITVINTGTTTYTAPAGTRAINVRSIGGGASGGGGASTALSASCGSGGGGGGYSSKFITNPSTSAITVAVGAGGAAPAAGNNAGNAGGDTTFDSPSVCTAKGGSPGLGGGIGLTIQGYTLGGAGGASASGVGDIKAQGFPGGHSDRLSGTAGRSGAGGGAAA
ncbi:MAG: hypothetical protein M3O91_03765, partial [Chloroflexota bacterium]|nr:hypothetical protein [Chloroflexota bacterium]